jgi:glyoxylase-like metal-dependent hydrolase (beta-lactamase superfamily II)
MRTLKIGDVTITSIIERDGPWRKPADMFPAYNEETAARHLATLEPEIFDPATGLMVITYQSFVVRTPKHTILVDTCTGDNKGYPAPMDFPKQRWLDEFKAAGLSFDKIDYVFCTHLHIDHCGWNTVLRDGRWVPTFPNARYLIPEADYRHFHPDNEDARPPARTEDEQARMDGSRIVWQDSVAPVDEAGQIVLWSDDHQISDALRLRPAPGHTPGSSVLWLTAGRPAVFVGDLTHSPMQLHRPMDPCAFDEDFEAAAVTRKRVLTEASRRRAAVIPAHYPGHGGATVVARGDGFMVDDWLEISAL